MKDGTQHNVRNGTAELQKFDTEVVCTADLQGHRPLVLLPPVSRVPFTDINGVIHFPYSLQSPNIYLPTSTLNQTSTPMICINHPSAVVVGPKTKAAVFIAAVVQLFAIEMPSAIDGILIFAPYQGQQRWMTCLHWIICHENNIIFSLSLSFQSNNVVFQCIKPEF